MKQPHIDAMRALSIALHHLTTPDYAHSMARNPAANELAHLRGARHACMLAVAAIDLASARAADAQTALAAAAQARAVADTAGLRAGEFVRRADLP